MLTIEQITASTTSYTTMQIEKKNKEVTEKEAASRLEAMCSRAEHCTFDMQEKMKRWGIDNDIQMRIIASLKKNKYINDERYARAFARDKIEYNKWGRRKVDQALRIKRIDEDIRNRVLNEIDNSKYAETLQPLLIAKMKSTKANSDYELSCKLIRFALGRGFEYEDIKNCLAHIIGTVDDY